MANSNIWAGHALGRATAKLRGGEGTRGSFPSGLFLIGLFSDWAQFWSLVGDALVDRLRKKSTPWHLWGDKSRLTGVPKKFAATPLVLNPFVPFRNSLHYKYNYSYIKLLAVLSLLLYDQCRPHLSRAGRRADRVRAPARIQAAKAERLWSTHSKRYSI